MDKATFTLADVTKKNTEVEFSLVRDKEDGAVIVLANKVELLWFDPHDGTVNCYYVDEEKQASLPGLNFDKGTNRVLLYAD
jgi:hypothetical protein